MSTPAKHVVLGASGVIGRETVRALRERGTHTVSVARRPSGVPGTEAMVADLLVASSVDKALAGAHVAYFVVGLPYSLSVWQQQWPVILKNVIASAVKNRTHLVYFDNVYALGAVAGAMTELTPVYPASKKGLVRATALHILDRAAAMNGLQYTVARSADFYGPGATTSVFNQFAIDRIASGKPATWLINSDQPHSMTYTPDIGSALAALGTKPSWTGRVWHLPTAPALTGREYIRLAGGPDAEGRTMSTATLRIGGLFSTPARETVEMRYQYKAPYVFDSGAFEQEFLMTPTSSADGIAATLAFARAHR